MDLALGAIFAGVDGSAHPAPMSGMGMFCQRLLHKCKGRQTIGLLRVSVPNQ